MSKALVIQATYTDVQVGYAVNGLISKQNFLEKNKASSLLILFLQELLDLAGTSFNELNYIVVNQGPAPYTTLRTVIATVNGLQFASGVPLIGIDGMRVFMQEHSQDNTITVGLLNAFNNDVFFAVHDGIHLAEVVCLNYELALKEVHYKYSNRSIHFIGNAVSLYEKNIRGIFGDQIFGQGKIHEYACLKQVAHAGHAMWRAGKIVHQISPLYLKSTHYKPSISG